MNSFDEFAKDLAEAIKNENTILHAKKEELAAELNKLEIKISEIAPKTLRAEQFKSDMRLCPRCFIYDALSIEMKPIPSESTSDIFKCRHCSSEIEVEN